MQISIGTETKITLTREEAKNLQIMMDQLVSKEDLVELQTCALQVVKTDEARQVVLQRLLDMENLRQFLVTTL